MLRRRVPRQRRNVMYGFCNNKFICRFTSNWWLLWHVTDFNYFPTRCLWSRSGGKTCLDRALAVFVIRHPSGFIKLTFRKTLPSHRSRTKWALHVAARFSSHPEKRSLRCSACPDSLIKIFLKLSIPPQPTASSRTSWGLILWLRGGYSIEFRDLSGWAIGWTFNRWHHSPTPPSAWQSRAVSTPNSFTCMWRENHTALPLRRLACLPFSFRRLACGFLIVTRRESSSLLSLWARRQVVELPLHPPLPAASERKLSAETTVWISNEHQRFKCQIVWRSGINEFSWM